MKTFDITIKIKAINEQSAWEKFWNINGINSDECEKSSKGSFLFWSTVEFKNEDDLCNHFNSIKDVTIWHFEQA